ncbi:palmitoyltransferase ZDHHC14 isoform X2 [Nematostella vectensis]|uniref:palmitoyltransferase ZDHHC14 isoform X2 n=1 Tax=Nematostella vectensis TaxID=45351 RepID=UPI0020771AF4|nr:palmitoyltransferase ZDHHC14 isoform X2 [Nematostella vectensis]
MTSETAKTKQYSPIMSRRNWEVFPGRNKFYCDGRIIMARNNGVFYFTVILIVITTGLFFAFDSVYLFKHLSPAVPIIAAWLFFFVMATLLRTAFSDPGIVPRASADEAAYIEKSMERFDHHCPWVGNCVGKRNYKFFYMFLLSLSIHCCYIFAFVIIHLVMLTNRENRSFVDAMKESPASILEAVVCFFSIWSIVGLTGFHTYLVASNQTTNEDIKGSFSSRRGQDNYNPYSVGSSCGNCLAVICGPMEPSLLDRRGMVIPEPPESADSYGALGTTSQPRPGSPNGISQVTTVDETKDSTRTPEKNMEDALKADSDKGLVKLSSV